MENHGACLGFVRRPIKTHIPPLMEIVPVKFVGHVAANTVVDTTLAAIALSATRRQRCPLNSSSPPSGYHSDALLFITVSPRDALGCDPGALYQI